MSTPKENKLINKTQSETYKQLIEKTDINNILNQPNIILKERHHGLLIKKINNDIINDNTENKEAITQTDTTEEKSDINLTKYSCNSLTIFELKKISKLRQKIHNELIPELDKKTIEKNQLVSNQNTIISDIFKIKKELLKLRNNLIEAKMSMKINEKIKKQKITDSEIRKLSDIEEIDIKNKEKQLKELEKNKKNIAKQITKIKRWIVEKENKLNKIKSKLNEYDNKLNIPFAKPDSWFNKSDLKIKLEKEMASSISKSEKQKISKKISKLDKEMIKIWDGKKVEKIYEEILPIENKIIFLTTFQHVDNSITEEVMYFQELTNRDIKIFKQNKLYKNINNYKKDRILIENTSTNKNNCQYVPIKDFLKYQQDFKLKPNKSEKKIWWTITIISLTLIILTPILTFAIPALIPATATALLLETKIIIAVTSSGLGTIFKGFTSIFSPATKKVESWWYNKLCKNNEKKEKEKNERQSIIKNLTSDKLETKLETQFKILKQELDNRKNKNFEELINNNTINHNSNSLLENSSIQSENNWDFDSSIRNTVNHQNQQPSTSTIYHSNSML